MRLTSIPSIRKSKPRRRIIRNDEEKHALDQIAAIFDEQEKAFSLLKRNLNNGYINTPDGDLPIQEFLKAQLTAFEKRQSLGISNSIQFLRGSILTRALTCGGFSQAGEGVNLDEIEQARDAAGQYKGKYGKYYND